MTNKKTIRWGMIGCGDVTEVKSGPAYKITEGFDIVAVMRRDAEKVRDYAERHGISKYYTDADALINDPDVDAVYIATPPDSHKAYGLKVADANKPCCIEKPLAPNFEDSEAIYTAFKDKHLPLFVAYYRRSLPRYVQVKKWLESNAIGDVRHVHWQLSSSPNEKDLSGEYNWRTDPAIAPGGYFDDLASHGLDLIAYYLGNFKKVSGISLNQQGLYKTKDAITASWLHNDGITGSGYWNFGSAFNEEKVEILGSKGKIVFSIFEENPVILKTLTEETVLEIEHPKHIQINHVQDMKADLFGTGVHPSTGATATHTSWVMDKILGNIKN